MSEFDPGRAEVLKALRRRLSPKLRGLGFRGSPPHYRRVLPDRVDLVSVQFDRHGGRFCVEVATAPSVGFTSDWGKHTPSERLTAFHLNPPARLRLSPHEGDWWFSYDRGRGDFSGDEDACASAAAEMLVTLGQAWFASR